MLHNVLLTALAAVLPLSCASTVPTDFTIAQRSAEINAVASDHKILGAFIEANHPDASPNRTLPMYGDYDMFMFKEEEWQAMRSSLLQKAGIDESVVMNRDLAIRQNQDPPVFFCDGLNSGPVAYGAKLGAATTGVCTAIVNGRTGYRYIFRRNVTDARPGSQNSGAIQAVISFLPKVIKWAATGGCSIALGAANTGTCLYLVPNTPQGEKQVASGFTADNAEVSASVSFEDIPG